jgi:hypothetical protein
MSSLEDDDDDIDEFDDLDCASVERQGCFVLRPLLGSALRPLEVPQGRSGRGGGVVRGGGRVAGSGGFVAGYW